MRFCVIKASRKFDGHGYQGPSLKLAGYPENSPAEFVLLEEAKFCAQRLDVANPVGWQIFDRELGPDAAPVYRTV